MPNLDQHRRELPSVMENMMRSMACLLEEIETVPSIDMLQASDTYASARRLQQSVNDWLRKAAGES